MPYQESGCEKCPSGAQEKRIRSVLAFVGIFLRRMRARGLKLGRLTPVSKKSLSDMKQTYEEWLDKARNVLFIASASPSLLCGTCTEVWSFLSRAGYLSTQASPPRP